MAVSLVTFGMFDASAPPSFRRTRKRPFAVCSCNHSPLPNSPTASPLKRRWGIEPPRTVQCPSGCRAGRTIGKSIRYRRPNRAIAFRIPSIGMLDTRDDQFPGFNEALGTEFISEPRVVRRYRTRTRARKRPRTRPLSVAVPVHVHVPVNVHVHGRSQLPPYDAAMLSSLLPISSPLNHRPRTMTPALRATLRISWSGFASSRMRSARLPGSTVPDSLSIP